MAHHISAKKRLRRNTKRARINHDRMSRVRTFMRKVEEAIVAGDKDAANVALKEAQPEMHRGVSKGVIHRNTVDRKLSRFNKSIKALA